MVLRLIEHGHSGVAASSIIVIVNNNSVDSAILTSVDARIVV